MAAARRRAHSARSKGCQRIRSVAAGSWFVRSRSAQLEDGIRGAPRIAIALLLGLQLGAVRRCRGSGAVHSFAHRWRGGSAGRPFAWHRDRRAGRCHRDRCGRRSGRRRWRRGCTANNENEAQCAKHLRIVSKPITARQFPCRKVSGTSSRWSCTRSAFLSVSATSSTVWFRRCRQVPGPGSCTRETTSSSSSACRAGPPSQDRS